MRIVSIEYICKVLKRELEQVPRRNVIHFCCTDYKRTCSEQHKQIMFLSLISKRLPGTIKLTLNIILVIDVKLYNQVSMPY
jgi:hypothetical protein